MKHGIRYWAFGVMDPVAVLRVPPGDAEGLHPVFADRLARLCEAVPGLYVLSGYRSSAEQAYLYDGWVRRLHGFNPANPPGVSNHEFGVAADLAGDLAAAHRIASGLGLHWPVAGEAWHVQPVEVRGGSWPGDMPEIL